MDPEPRPHVVILGGFLTEPFLYRTLRDRLLVEGASSVTIAPIHAIDWMAAGLVGLGPLLVRSGLAIRRTHRRTGGHPLLVVGHSGGGILGRLALSQVAYQGRVAAVADAVGCLVTLGTPHGLPAAPLRWPHPGVDAAAFLARADAVTAPDPRTALVTVGSTAVHAPDWDRAPMAARLANLPYRLVVGRVGPGGGDGIVGVELAHLPHASQVTLPDATHGTFGRRWYGDEEIIGRWWPFAVEQWREALAARERTAREHAHPTQGPVAEPSVERLDPPVPQALHPGR